MLQFERDHCGDALRLDGRQSIGRLSPPKNFFRDNLNPFPSSKPSSIPVPRANRRNDSTQHDKQQQQRNNRGRPPAKPLRTLTTTSPLMKVLGCVKGNTSSSCGSDGSSHAALSSVVIASDTKTSGGSSGMYNRFDLRSTMGNSQIPMASSVEDEDEEDAADEVVGTASDSGGSSSGICSGSEPQSDPQPPPPTTRSSIAQSRMSISSQPQRFVQNVNKYGDVVEYAIVEPATNADGHQIDDNLNVINASFRSKILIASSNPNVSTSVRQTPTPAPRNLCVQVTDLDASMTGGRSNTSIASLVQRSCMLANGSGCPELDVLESWSQNVTDRNRVPCDFLDRVICENAKNL